MLGFEWWSCWDTGVSRGAYTGLVVCHVGLQLKAVRVLPLRMDFYRVLPRIM